MARFWVRIDPISVQSFVIEAVNLDEAYNRAYDRLLDSITMDVSRMDDVNRYEEENG